MVYRFYIIVDRWRLGSFFRLCVFFGDADGVAGIAHALVQGGELFVVFLEVCLPRTRISEEKMPCLRAFILEALQPSPVLGPVDFRALAWLAAICSDDTFVFITGDHTGTGKE